MRFVSKFAVLMLGAALGAGAQEHVNPHTQVNWPAACSAANTVYSFANDTCITIGGGGGGGVTPSPQFSLFYQPIPGTQAAAQGDPNITTDGNGHVVVKTLQAGGPPTGFGFHLKALSTIPADWTMDTTTPTTAIQSMLPGVVPDGTNGLRAATINGAYHTSGALPSCTIGGNSYTTKGDCAFYTAVAAAAATGLDQQLILDPGETDTCAGWTVPHIASNASVMLTGSSASKGNIFQPISQLKATCALGSSAVITYAPATVPDGDGPAVTVSGVYINANGNANACLDVIRAGRGLVTDNFCIGATGDHGYRFGDNSLSNNYGWVYETEIVRNTLVTDRGTPPVTATGQLTIAGGSATGVYTVISAGASYGTPSTYVVLITGWGVGVNQNNMPSPCTTVPTGTINSFTAGGIDTSSITFTGGVGCDPDHTYFVILPISHFTKGFWFDHATDLSAESNVVDGPVGITTSGNPTTAQFFFGTGGNYISLKDAHGYAGEQIMIAIYGHDINVDGPRCDTVSQVCVWVGGPFNWVHGAMRTWGASFPGAGDFWSQESGISNRKASIFGPFTGCHSGNQTNSNIGYNLIGGINGPYVPESGTSYPFSIVGGIKCNIIGTTLNPFEVTTLPRGVAVGNTIWFADLNHAGSGEFYNCEAKSWVGIPGYDADTGIVSFPGDGTHNGGFLRCIDPSGNNYERSILSTGIATQTFSMADLKTTTGTVDTINQLTRLVNNVPGDQIGNQVFTGDSGSPNFVVCNGNSRNGPVTVAGGVLTFPSDGTHNGGSAICTSTSGVVVIQAVPNSGTPTVSQTWSMDTDYANASAQWVKISPSGFTFNGKLVNTLPGNQIGNQVFSGDSGSPNFVVCNGNSRNGPVTVSGVTLTFPSDGLHNGGSVICTDTSGVVVMQSVPNSGTPTVSQTWSMTTDYLNASAQWLKVSSTGVTTSGPAVILPLIATAPASTVPLSTTDYALPTGQQGFGGGEASREIALPRSCTIANLMVCIGTAQPSGGGLTFTYRTGPFGGTMASQTLTVSFAASAAASCLSDTTHSFAYTAGNAIDVQIVNASAAGASGGITSIYAECQNPH